MLNMAHVVSNPRLGGAQAFTVNRHAGSFQNEGVWTESSPTVINMTGNVQPATQNDILNFLPEGERQSNAIRIYAAGMLVMGNGDDKQSDVIIWNGDYYRVAFSKPWDAFGYWFAIAVGFVHG